MAPSKTAKPLSKPPKKAPSKPAKTTRKTASDATPSKPARKRKAASDATATNDAAPPEKKPKKSPAKPKTSAVDSTIKPKKPRAKAEPKTPKRATKKAPAATTTETSEATGFYQAGSTDGVPSAVEKNLKKLFDDYRDNPKESPDKIGIDGAQNYLGAIKVQLDELAHLAICDLLQCPSIGEFDRDPFVAGWRSASSANKPCDTVAAQAQYVDVIRKKMSADPAYFKQVYRNAFKLAKPEGQRSVPMESAVDFWNMFFRSDNGGLGWNTASTKWLDMWCEFYETNIKRPVNKDLWNMVGEMALKIKEPDGEALEWWSPDGAWPMAIDDFISHVKDKTKSAGGDDAMDTS
ncbi:uncharacterized protein PV06_08675 [Exophiala oligosperma]|uniref:Defective in cullin neddylation protein n=1 Tax=Exophiala oligosperma TaxID=215243 RepID=A0A0D2BMY3_9EURO|nr:uncharacterized protein PV06_08675 [Exophiala oligosperma]KIW38842.1 hypothetical protein PV06_08675 [Exophiala oligosperma]